MRYFYIAIVAVPLLLVAAFAGVGYYEGFKAGASEMHAKVEAEKVAAIEAARAREHTLQERMDQFREDKNREMAKLNRTVRSLTDSLRNRPERPAIGTPASAGGGATGCTGAELYRPDAEFLVGEADRADRIRIALIQCQAAYAEAGKK